MGKGEFYETYGDPSLLEHCATCKATGQVPRSQNRLALLGLHL